MILEQILRFDFQILVVSECEFDKFRALCICGTRLTSVRRLPRPRIWVLGRDTIPGEKGPETRAHLNVKCV
ncbi:hypothetical protein SLEP1_g51884 [Rubroshorea leprosula]|uniref:Uncharacterized protein n=1 Tax=Rubroshorea leprosula TaxID=152421 RepID=A0AAV5M4N8_9ROSI|nr:hypothetical protein SLEP1_g51884 [Rubroshorea leprosula]